MFTALPRRSRPSRTFHRRRIVEALEDRLLLSLDVGPGFDLWETAPTCASGPSTFSDVSLPPDFFGPGSQPFQGRVTFQGVPTGPLGHSPGPASFQFDEPLRAPTGQFDLRPLPPGPLGGPDLGLTDTIVQRLGPASMPGAGDSATVPIEIVSLSLVSCEPIVVQYSGPPFTAVWDVRVDLNPATTQPQGSMTLTRTHVDGGAFTSQFLVQPRFTFTNRDPSGPQAQGQPEIQQIFTGQGTFQVPVQPTEKFFESNSVLPEHGQFFSPEGDRATFDNGLIVLSDDTINMLFATAPPRPPELGMTDVQTFTACYKDELTDRGTTSSFDVCASADGRVQVTHTRDDGGTQFYDTEMLQLDISGGSLLPGWMIRESPTRASLGRTTIRQDPGGGYRIGSFFDIFPELSTDGGQTWLQADKAAHLDLTRSLEGQFGDPSVPPPGGKYLTPEMTQTQYENGVIVKNVVQQSIRGMTFAPPPGMFGVAVDNDDSEIVFVISTDGGNSFSPQRVPAQSRISFDYNRDLVRTQVYDTEMLQLDLSGGTLAPGWMIRESPTRASLGRTTVRQVPDGYEIGSFFDVFSELSTDGGQSWSPSVAPLHFDVMPLPGSIHGFKFEDLDGDGGRDAGEPGIGGVPIQVIGSNGQANIVFNTTTMADGEYWFDGLPQDFTYTVSETAPAGSIQTTLNPPPITIRSGQEFVATEEQRDALIRVGFDPSRVFIEPALSFGNTFLGSIHGFKFEDVNGNGQFDPWRGCTAPDNGQNTVDLPSGGCTYRAVDAFIWFKNATSSLVVDMTLGNFRPLLASGGGAGGVTRLNADMTLDITGTGEFVGYHRTFILPHILEVSGRSMNPGDPVQSFDADMRKLFGQLPPGDPDFDLLRITAGTDFGMPSPGHTTLTLQPGGNWAVDSFFDIEYRIDFVGAPGGPFAGIAVNEEGTHNRLATAPSGPAGAEGGPLAPEPLNPTSVRFDLDGIDGLGNPVSRTTTTDQHGNYSFDGLMPGVYSVREAALTGWVPTTPANRGPFDLRSRQELVVFPGQAGLDPKDPRVEVLLGGTLMFGNTVPGSIHGFKFEDRDGDGRYDPHMEMHVPDFGDPADLQPGVIIQWLVDVVEPIIVAGGLPNDSPLAARASLAMSSDPVITRDGGTLGGSVTHYTTPMRLDFMGTGDFAGFERPVTLDLNFSVDGSRPAGSAAALDLDWDVRSVFGQLRPGDPDFDLLRIVAGTGFGMPSPGHSTLTRLADGTWAVDSFFDIEYRIDFVGAPGGVLAGRSGSTTGTIRLESPRPEHGDVPLGGVEFTATGTDGMGNLVSRTETTNEHGEFWFTGLLPGNYVVRENPPAGSVPTRPPVAEFVLHSREEFVAFPGQAMLGPNDPRREIVVGDKLIFGDTFFGSIHGFKFEDLDGDGKFEPGDAPPIICSIPDDGGSGVVVLPPAPCVLTTTEAIAIDRDLVTDAVLIEDAHPGGQGPGGGLGGGIEVYNSTLRFDLRGTESLEGFNRPLTLPLHFETHVGPRVPGTPVQSFDTDMFRMQGQLPAGDPDFDLLRITAGTGFGLPSPGHTTLTQLPGGSYAVDSFFDITYRIDFVGAPGGSLAGRSGSTTGTIRMATQEASGTPGGGDHGLGGVQIVLSGTDANGNPVSQTQQTNGRGEFWFEQLLPGVYAVTEVVPAGFVPTTPTVTGPFVLNSRIELVALAGQAMLGEGDPRVEVVVGPRLMFGNIFDELIPGSIHGYKFEDLNGDGDDEGGRDPRVPGVTFRLTGVDALGQNVLVSARTDDNGEFWFTGLRPGRYTVNEQPPVGSVPTTPVAVELTVASGEEYVVFAGQAMLPDGARQHEVVVGDRLKFGNTYPGSIHGFKFYDRDGDGVYEPLRPTVVADGNADSRKNGSIVAADFDFSGTQNRLVEMKEILISGLTELTPPERLVATQDGDFFAYGTLKYGVWGVGPLAGYRREIAVPVEFQLHAGPSLVAGGVQSFDTEMLQLSAHLPAGDPDFDLLRITAGSAFGMPSPGHTRLTQLADGNWSVDSFFDIEYRIDFVGAPGGPLAGESGSVAGTAHGATPGSETGDRPLGGVEIVLTGTDPHGEPLPPQTTTTNDHGEYWFTGLLPGQYFAAERGGVGDITLRRTTQPRGPVTIRSREEFVAFPGQAMLDPNDPQHEVVVGERLMIGNTRLGSIHGFKFEDIDGDGLTPNDPGLGGVTIKLFGTTATGLAFNATTTTAADGRFSFDGLLPGLYGLSEIPPAGSVPITHGAIFPFQLLAGQEFVFFPGQANLGPNDPRKEVVASFMVFGNAFLGSIHGYKFEDVNADGDDENGTDPRLPGVRVTLVRQFSGGQTDEIGQTTTDTNGEFWFTGLKPGRYIVTETLPDDSVPTTPTTVEVTLRSREELVAFAGQAMLDPNGDPRHEVVLGDRLKFGNTFRGSIHGFKFEDKDGDGVFDREPCVVPDQGIGTVAVFSTGCVFSASERDVAAIDDILVVRRLDSASPQLFLDASGGRQEKFDGKLTVEFRREPTQPPRYLQFELKDVLVSGFTVGGHGGGDPNPTESISLNFTKIEFALAPGDPDFDLLRITAGSDFGMPSPGHATLTQLPEGNWNVDSFFDIEYRIDFLGTPGGILGGRSGSTTGTIRMASGDPVRPPEPPIGGVQVTLEGIDFRGQPVTQSETTDRYGEFWFEHLLPGTYSVTERPPTDSVPTTATTAGPFQLLSRQELVALGGQAMLDPADPQVEVLVGRPLILGNAYLGSIHGYKFEDLNGDGDDENGGDPRLGDVRITLTGVDGQNHTIAPVTTTTDSRGEYWFMGVVPGRYTITETPPAGTQATRPVSVNVSIASGEELVALAGQAHLPPNSVQHEVVLGQALTFGNRYTALDFGDARDPTFPTLYASNGARHIVRPGFFLGSRVDTEPNGQPTATANGDDIAGVPDDEDGVTINGSLQSGKNKTIRVVASAAGFLDAWIDFNGDGDWSDAGEQIFTRRALVPGTNSLNFTVPAAAVSNQTALARFRFSSAGGLPFNGLAADGEVEDFTVRVVHRGRSAARGTTRSGPVLTSFDSRTTEFTDIDRESGRKEEQGSITTHRHSRERIVVALDSVLSRRGIQMENGTPAIVPANAPSSVIQRSGNEESNRIDDLLSVDRSIFDSLI